MDMNQNSISFTNTSTWELIGTTAAMEDHHPLNHQLPFDALIWSDFALPLQTTTTTATITTHQIISNSSSSSTQVPPPPSGGLFGDPFEKMEEEEEDAEEEPEEELGAMKEMMYKIAAMQPVDIDPATIRKPKRRNVRISDDPQSIAARHRRERISEKIRILQRLVPGGTKMDTASMLEEAIRYVKFLKRHIRQLQSNNQHHHSPWIGVTAPTAGDWPRPVAPHKALGSTASLSVQPDMDSDMPAPAIQHAFNLR